MNEKYESGGFVTKYGSSPYDMIECLHIRITLWEDYPSLTSGNFNDVFIKISSNLDKYKFWDSYRSEYGNDIPFKFPPEDCDDPIKFNVIFYIKNDGTVAGYTQFLEVQDTLSLTELCIYTHFKYNTEVSDLILKNDLESHIYENFLENLDVRKTMEDTKYMTRFNIDTTYVSTFQRFTNFTAHLQSDKRYTLLTNRLIKSDNLVSRLGIMSIYSSYPNLSIGLYLGDLVVCSWSDYLYEVVSLTKMNDMGDRLVYYSGNIRTSVTSGGYGLKDYTISRVTPYCVVCHVTFDPKQETAIICLQDDLVRSKNPYQILVNDPYSVRIGCLVNNHDLENLKFVERIGSPEVYQKVIDGVYNGSIPGKLVRIDGSFSVFKVGEMYHYSNLEGLVISDKSNLMVLNDCTLIDQTETSLIFYFTYNNSIINTDGSTDDEYKYLIYEVDKSDIRNPLISSLRRNKINYISIPDILAAYGGLLFYKDENKYLKFI